METTRRKIRPDTVWAQVRKAWEGGETARSVAKRYDVGVPALWKRREAEGWARPEPGAGPVEPAEGWDAFAQGRMDAFEAEQARTRELALDLIAAMRGEPVTEAAMWHVGFIFAWRAEHLGPVVAEANREQIRGKPLFDALWDADGTMRSQAVMDLKVMRLNRETWRAEVGLPDGAAEDWP